MNGHNDMAVCTVIIPLYNKAQVVSRAMSSVMRQTERRWRLIVVDDGSTDQSMEEVARYTRDPRVEYIRQENAGPGAARNKGLELCETEYVAFLDADDEWETEFLSVSLDAFERNPGAVMTACAWLYGDERVDSRVKRRERGVTPGAWRFTEETDDIGPRIKARLDELHSSSCLVRADVIRDRGGFYEDRCTYGEDAYLWSQVLFGGEEIVYLDSVLLRFHTDASSLSVGRETSYPVPPILSESQRIIDAAPSAVRGRVRSYLAWYSRYVMRRALSQRSPAILLRAALVFARLKRYSRP